MSDNRFGIAGRKSGEMARRSLCPTFTNFFACNLLGVENDDMCILQHNNGVCLVCLADSHPLVRFKDRLIVSDVDFRVRLASDCLGKALRGKRKKNAQMLGRDSVLCRVRCEDGSEFALRAAISGSVVEINSYLMRDRRSMQTDPRWTGWIAVMVPNVPKANFAAKNDLLTLEEYRAGCSTCTSVKEVN